MSQNPLQSYFRQPNAFITLPTQGRWYQPQDITLAANKELAIYGMTARDDVLLNTPDAMLNGEALKKVIQNCVPDIHNVNALMMPDLEAIFVGMRIASNSGKMEIFRICPNCKAECIFDLQCQAILDSQTMIDSQDGVCDIDGELKVYVRPYTFQQRSIFIQREFEEEKTVRAFDSANPDPNEFLRAGFMAETVDRISTLTFQLVAASIEKIEIVEPQQIVSDLSFITEWLMSITSAKAEKVIRAVDMLNKCGPDKNLPIVCTSCNHQWQDSVTYDPISFFAKRS